MGTLLRRVFWVCPVDPEGPVKCSHCQGDPDAWLKDPWKGLWPADGCLFLPMELVFWCAQNSLWEQNPGSASSFLSRARALSTRVLFAMTLVRFQHAPWAIGQRTSLPAAVATSDDPVSGGTESFRNISHGHHTEKRSACFTFMRHHKVSRCTCP